MNDRSLHRRFEQAAADLPVTSTGVDTVIANATARTRRRRAAVASGSALAVVAVTVLGIERLSRVDDGAVPLDAPTPVVSAPPPDASPTPGTVAAAPVSVPGIDLGDASHPEYQRVLADATPAAPSAPVMTWAVYDADGPEALALRIGSGDDRYALATEPGAAFATRSLWERQGDEWVRVVDDVLPEGLTTAVVSGDAVYAIGTAPATAGGAPGSVGTYDIAAGDWSLVDLPAEIEPYRSERVSGSTEMTIAPVDGGALIAVTQRPAFVDWRLIEDVVPGGAIAGEPQWTDGALQVPTQCDQDAIDAELRTTIDTGANWADVWSRIVVEHCEVEVYTADDLGLTIDDVERLDAPQRASLWRFDGTALTPADLPVADALAARLDGQVLLTDTASDRRAWSVGADATFGEIFEGLGGLMSDGPRLRGDVATGAVANAIATQRSGGSTQLVDVSGVIVDDAMVDASTWISLVTADGDATVAMASVNYLEPGVLRGPVTYSDSGFDLVVAEDGTISVVEQATGRALSDYRLATTPGAVRLVSADSAPVPTSTTVLPGTVGADDVQAGEVIAEFTVDPTTLAPWAQRSATMVLSSIDGTAYAVERIDDLLGLDGDAGAQAYVHQSSVVDGRFVLTVWIQEPEGGTRSVFLVGTPDR